MRGAGSDQPPFDRSARPAAARPTLATLDGGSDHSRALIALEPRLPSAAPLHHLAVRPSAAFLAHLIAVAQRAPQTRQRRRAEPGAVSTAYAEAKLEPVVTGRAIRRSL